MKKNLLLSFSLFLLFENSNAQTSDMVLGDFRSYSPSASFLLIPTDAIAAGIGWSGVAADTTIYAEFYNPAQTAFAKGNGSLVVGYTAWLRAVVSDLNQTSAALKIKAGKRSTFNFSYSELSYGDIHITLPPANLKQIERVFGLSKSYLLNKSSAIGGKLKYIQSNTLANSQNALSSNLRTFSTVAFGLSYYHTRQIILFGIPASVNFGTSLDNIGGKIGNDTLGLQAFIPAIIRVGQALRINPKEVHHFTLQLEFSKLLTPGSPIYKIDSLGNRTNEIISGDDPNQPVFNAMINSFSDAPEGFKGEINEIRFSGGIEYGYSNIFSMRTGYYHETRIYDRLRFFTVGGTASFTVVYSLEFSVAYMIPIDHRNPFENTLSFSLRIN